MRSRKEAAAVLLDPDEGLGASILSVDLDQTKLMSELRTNEAGTLASAPSRAAAARWSTSPACAEPRSLPRGRTWILIVADMVAITLATAITYTVAELVASPAVIAPTG